MPGVSHLGAPPSSAACQAGRRLWVAYGYAMSKALARFELLIADVDNLIAHHPKSGSPIAGRPSGDEGPLLRSCVVLTYGAWEVYFEDSLVEAVSLLADGRREDLPGATLDWVQTMIKDPWVLADNGWRQELVRLVKATMYGDPGNPASFGVNSASPGVVAEWTRTILGATVLGGCSWPGASSDTVRRKLSDLVRLRGEIAHGGRPARLSLGEVRRRRDFTRRLAEKYDEVLFDFIASTAAAPAI